MKRRKPGDEYPWPTVTASTCPSYATAPYRPVNMPAWFMDAASEALELYLYNLSAEQAAELVWCAVEGRRKLNLKRRA